MYGETSSLFSVLRCSISLEACFLARIRCDLCKQNGITKISITARKTRLIAVRMIANPTDMAILSGVESIVVGTAR